MKKIYLFLCILITFLNTSICAGQAGILDNNYGTGGVVTTSVGPHSSEGWGMVIQSDWSVVVGGFMYNGSDSDFALIRYKPDGSLDSDFGNNGMVVTDLGHGHDVIYSVALGENEKIVAGGITWNGTDYDFAVARYNTDGSLDNSFGTNGIVTTSIGPGNDKGVSLKIQSDWSVVLGGTMYNGSNDDFAVVRYLSNGTLDSTFGVNGKATVSIGAANDRAFAIEIQPSDWSVVIGGVAYNGTDYDFALARLTTNGTLDNTFGTNGRITTDISQRKDMVWALALQPNEKILLGGYSTNAALNKDFTLVQYKKNGMLDPDFGTNGKVTTGMGTGDEDIYSLVIQPDGKIIAGGTADSNGVENYALVRYNTDGSLDNSFGSNGQVTTLMDGGDNEIYSVALQPDGKIVAAGYASDSVGYKFCVARYLTGLNVGVIDFTASDNSMFIYPNPVAQNAILEYTLSKEEQVSIRLIDVQGRVVKTFADNQMQAAGEYKQPIILPQGLASGSYVISISSLSGKMSIKIVK